MVAMASDSYLLKTAAQPPCQACCRASDSTACRATSCGVVVTLVLLLAAVVGLGGVLYYQRMMLCSVLADLSSMERIIQRVDTNIVRLHQELQYKTFGVEHKDPEEEEALSDDSDGDGDSDDVDYDLADYDDGLLYQNNNPMGTTTPRSEDNEPLARDRHSVLGQGKNGLATTPAILKETESDSSEARGTGETDEGHIWRWRRDVGLATGRRADPQLRLYHMLQAPDHAVPFAAAPEGTWSQRGQHRGPGFLPMYAEHAPLEYVMPPRANIATTPSPIASRRSRVMAGPPAAAVPGRLQPSQFDRHPHQHGQLEGAEAARRQDGRATRRRRPSPTQAQAVPSRGPWRGVRVIDTFHQ